LFVRACPDVARESTVRRLRQRRSGLGGCSAAKVMIPPRGRMHRGQLHCGQQPSNPATQRPAATVQPSARTVDELDLQPDCPAAISPPLSVAVLARCSSRAGPPLIRRPPEPAPQDCGVAVSSRHISPPKGVTVCTFIILLGAGSVFPSHCPVDRHAASPRACGRRRARLCARTPSCFPSLALSRSLSRSPAVTPRLLIASSSTSLLSMFPCTGHTH